MSATLSPDVVAMIEARTVNHGYATADDLVRDALRLMAGGAGIRVIAMLSFLIFYRAAAGQVVILRVLHSARRITRRMIRGN